MSEDVLSGMFDPNGDHETPSENVDTAGVYYACFVRFLARDETRKGTPYIRLQGMVLGGSQEGRTFKHDLWLSARAAGRLAAMCKVIGVTKSFNLDSDESVAHALMLLPFKVRITMDETQNGKRYANVDSFIPDMPNEALKACQARIAQHVQDLKAMGRQPYEIADYKRAMTSQQAASVFDDSGSDPRTGLPAWDRPSASNASLFDDDAIPF